MTVNKEPTSSKVAVEDRSDFVWADGGWTERTYRKYYYLGP